MNHIIPPRKGLQWRNSHSRSSHIHLDFHNAVLYLQSHSPLHVGQQSKILLFTRKRRTNRTSCVGICTYFDRGMDAFVYINNTTTSEFEPPIYTNKTNITFRFIFGTIFITPYTMCIRTHTEGLWGHTIVNGTHWANVEKFELIL